MLNNLNLKLSNEVGVSVGQQDVIHPLLQYVHEAFVNHKPTSLERQRQGSLEFKIHIYILFIDKQTLPC